MAKHRLQNIRRMQAGRLLLCAALVLGLGASPGWAGQQPSTSTPSKAKTAQAGPRNRTRTAPVKSAGPAPQRQRTTATSSLPSSWAGRRDPFKLPVYGAEKGSAVVESAAGEALPPGERGLLISHLILEGTVREETENKMIAVVTNETKRAYFLRENQAVYNGIVSKITPDSIYFKENVLDTNGRVTTREVVKRLGSVPGEER